MEVFSFPSLSFPLFIFSLLVFMFKKCLVFHVNFCIFFLCSFRALIKKSFRKQCKKKEGLYPRDLCLCNEASSSVPPSSLLHPSYHFQSVWKYWSVRRASRGNRSLIAPVELHVRSIGCNPMYMFRSLTCRECFSSL